ncbi:MAG: peptide chain release factor 2 [Acidobacteria bacterium]|nr:peptide chain release factor 2 [Acidobacteriota bacterium]
MSLRGRQRNLEAIFDQDELGRRINALQDKLLVREIWNNKEEAVRLLKEKKQLEERLDVARKLNDLIGEIEVMLELADEGEEVTEDIEERLKVLEEELNQAEINLILNEENDENNAILTIHPGAGGTESQDWASMLLRMYLRWAERRGFEAKVMDYLPGEEAGLKSATVSIKGRYAYGYLKGESGVHRLVRISPFDASRRRHTSFASVFVYPELDEEIKIEINEKDLKIETFRASGHGGQHVNVTDSAVRITHLPTGIVVQCQNERSQHQNKAFALKVLKARLYERARQEKLKEKEKLEKGKKDISFGSQIRSYVLHPYQMIKDHRTGLEIGDATRVLDGDIDPFIQSYLRLLARKRS